MSELNPTHDARLKSWIESANQDGSDFPIQNLPFGVFSGPGRAKPRVGVAIGDFIIDLCVLEAAGLLHAAPAGQRVFDRPSLNAFIELGRDAWRATRATLSHLLAADTAVLRDDAALVERALAERHAAQLLLPIEIPGYTDFYSSREHATNVGSMFRDPKNALMPNWLELPVAYNGRASSVIVSGTPVRRPKGQLKGPDQPRPSFGPSRKLDIELETGFIVGRGNALGEPIPVDQAEEHIFGMVLLNDWSARDIQQWEYVPLGPFNSKGFATSISPWVVTLEALAPFRIEMEKQEPQPLPYLLQQQRRGIAIELEVALKPEGAPRAETISRTSFKHMYWSLAQQLAHHTVAGCNTRVGDLMGSGTISGTTPESCGSLLEITWNGSRPLELSDGSRRSFIEDGDELTLRGWCEGDGYRVGFGEVSASILPATA